MSDIGSEKWAQSVSLPGATMDAATAQQLLEEIPRRIAQGKISVGEDFPSSEEELRTRKRLPLLYAILGKGVFLDYLTGVSGFGERSLSVGLENAVDDERMKTLFPLQWGLFGSGFPATIIVHGSADTEVSCGESEKLAAKLQENGIGVQYYAVPGADHVFDLGLQECHEKGEKHEPSVVLARALQTLHGYVER
jgi:acetyl esterase/lipase